MNFQGDEIDSITLPDHYMSGIAADGDYFWVSTYYPDPGTIYKINHKGEIINQIPSPNNQPWDISLAHMGLWVSDYWGDAVYNISENDGSIIHSYETEGVDPSGVVWDGSFLWYCDNGINYDYDLLYHHHSIYQ